SVKIKLTARCNLKCTMCRYGRGERPPELPTERWLAVIDELAAMGCRKMHLSGGEVMVRKDLEALVARGRERRLKVTLTSNLTLLDKARAKALMRLRPSGISTSLDGARAKTHDRIRGIEGSFKRTVSGLALLQRHRRHLQPRIRVNFVMLRDNYAEYPEVVRLAAELGAVDVVPMPVDSKRRSIRLNKRLIRDYNERVAPEVAAARAAAGMRLDAGRVYPFGRDKEAVNAASLGHYAAGYYEDHLCFAPYLHMFVAWDGDVFLCCMTNGRIEPLGNLGQQGVREVFTGARFQAIRAAMRERRLDSCHACDMMLDDNRELETALSPESPLLARRRLPLIA
ncbi:MAG: radical SAM protein, partial [Myxococcales bacterium]|nr:radical SAM protein [Myxococcales bacterium]